MSKLTLISRPRTISTTIWLESGKTMGRFDSACGAIGTSTIPPRVGCSKGPPADSEYAVEPVGVEMIKPSERWLYMEVAVDFDAQFGHAGAAAARDDDIVDGHAHVNRLAVAQHAAFEQGAAFGLEAAAENLRQHGQHALERDIGHEAQAPLIDTDQGNIEWRQLARNAQHGAVAAHDDGAIGGGADLGRRHGAHAGKRQVQMHGRLRLEDHRVAQHLQEVDDAFDGLGNAIRILAHDQGDGLGAQVEALARGWQGRGWLFGTLFGVCIDGHKNLGSEFGGKPPQAVASHAGIA